MAFVLPADITTTAEETKCQKNKNTSELSRPHLHNHIPNKHTFPAFASCRGMKDMAASSFLNNNNHKRRNKTVKRKKEVQRLPERSIYLLYLIIELLAVLYIQGRLVLDPGWYVRNYIYATAGYIFIKILIYCMKRLRLAGSSLRKIDKMTGEEFEAYLGLLYDRKGYKVRYTPQSSDFGADLLLKKKGVKTVVQAKRYKNPVGEASVQQALSGKGYYDADQCVVITNSYFTPAAEALAERTGVTLIDRELLGTKQMYV